MRFGEVAASYQVNSATKITATVPAGISLGPISVTTVAGSATSASSFMVLATLARQTVNSHAGLALELYPNPADPDAAVRVQGAAAGAAVTVYDLAGREVLRAVANADGEATLKLLTLRTGVYVVRAGAHTQRLVVE